MVAYFIISSLFSKIVDLSRLWVSTLHALRICLFSHAMIHFVITLNSDAENRDILNRGVQIDSMFDQRVRFG